MHKKAVLAALAIALLVGAGAADPLADAIQKWSAFLSSDAAKGGVWDDIKPGAEPVVARAAEALRQGRRLLALQRLAAAWPNLDGARWAAARNVADGHNEARLESEWKLAGNELRTSVPLSHQNLSDIEPAAIRALAEVAAGQVRGYYDASLTYARATLPDAGFFYLGAARGQQSFIDFARTLSQKTASNAPTLRPIDAELDALERDLLEVYRPPASIDRHGEFIGASSVLKEARELNAAGLRYGALLRYLEAARRTAQLRAKAIGPDDISARLREFESKLRGANTDHTIAEMYVESAQSDLDSANSDTAVASAIATYVLPRYFAAIGPAAPAKTKPPARVTVTLVRWPYT